MSAHKSDIHKEILKNWLIVDQTISLMLPDLIEKEVILEAIIYIIRMNEKTELRDSFEGYKKICELLNQKGFLKKKLDEEGVIYFV